jgi:hypothetical protein
MFSYMLRRAGLALLLLPVSVAWCGVTNPDLSVIGLMRTFITNDKTDLNRDRTQISFDETELVADAALNPFAHGTFVFAVADGSIDVEEGFLTIVRGLPDGFALKAGKYRVGFGKLNPVHDHAYPFIERFRVLAAYLPGDESYNEVGGQVSYRLPLPGDIASTLSADILQGNSFHPNEDGARAAWVARWSNFLLLQDPSALEFGVDASQGVNNVALKATTTLYGADAKLKWWLNPRDNLILQAEVLGMVRERKELNEDSALITSHMKPFGGYLFANYSFRKRYGVGVKYERFQRPALNVDGVKPWDQSVGAFAELGLMEETTLFRLNWDRFIPEGETAFNTLTFQILFSMGPHKAHQF